MARVTLLQKTVDKRTRVKLQNMKLIWAFIRVNRPVQVEVMRGQLVHTDKRMTLPEFQTALKQLVKERHIYSPRKNAYSVTKTRPPREFGMAPATQVAGAKLKFPKRKIRKAKAIVVKRKYFEGYKCRRCGFFIDRPWNKRKIFKCPRCERKQFYGKPILVKSERKEEKLTKKGRQFLKIARESAWKITMPTLEHRGIKTSQVMKREKTKGDAEIELALLRGAGDDRPYRIVQARDPVLRETNWYIIFDPTLPRVELPKPKGRGRPRVHVPREKYKGSQTAVNAARKAWETRKRRKGEKGEKVLVGFFKDDDGTTRPVTKSAAELKRKKVVKKPRAFKGVKPITTKKPSGIEIVGVNVAPEAQKWSVKRSSSSKGITIKYGKRTTVKESFSNIKEARKARDRGRVGYEFVKFEHPKRGKHVVVWRQKR